MKLAFRLAVAALLAAFLMFVAPSSGTWQSPKAQPDAVYDSDPHAGPDGIVVSERQQLRQQLEADLTSYCIQDDTERGSAFDFSLSNQHWTLYYDKKAIANGVGFISRASDDIVIDSFFADYNIVGVVQPFYKRASLTIWYGHSASFTITDSNLDDSSCEFAAPLPPPPPTANTICFVETVTSYNHAQILFDTRAKTWTLTYDTPNGDQISGTYEDGPGPESFIPQTDNSGDHATWYAHGTGTYERGRYAGNFAKLIHAYIFPGQAPNSLKRGGAYVRTYVPNLYGNFVFVVESSVLDRKLEGGCR